MPDAGGSETPAGGSGGGTSAVGFFGGAVTEAITPRQPMTPAEWEAWSAANPPPVANVIVSYDAAGNLVTTNTSLNQNAGAPSDDIDTDAPTARGVLVFAMPGQAATGGGEGDGALQGNAFVYVLHGGDGNDWVLGSSASDDVNGNDGDDTIDGGSGGSDWLLGGQGDDRIMAHHGDNLMLGNLGDDTLNAGDGQDVLRGGQGDDVIIGGAGHDFISGDRGNDTETGGTGPTLFHGSQNLGLDVITNFSYAKGDRVELDPGTTYSVSQVGADTVIDMGSGNHMVLQNVQLSTLHSDWFFESALTHI